MPGVKPGLANVVTLVAFMHFSWRVAAWVAILRVLLGSVIIGTFLSPTFMLSLSGSLCSVLMLWLAGQWSRNFQSLRLGAIGYGVVAAMAHMGGQFWLAYWLFIPHPGLLTLLPVLMTMALVFGTVSGLITHSVISRLADKPHEHY